MKFLNAIMLVSRVAGVSMRVFSVCAVCGLGAVKNLLCLKFQVPTLEICSSDFHSCLSRQLLPEVPLRLEPLQTPQKHGIQEQRT